MAFYLWYSKSNTTELEYDLYYTTLVHIQRHFSNLATKFNISKVVGGLRTI